MELSKLAEKDPEFYKYLQENDQELLDFNLDDAAPREEDEDEATGIYHGDAKETEPLWEPGKGRDVARSLLKR